jgi:hypothetical protein
VPVLAGLLLMTPGTLAAEPELRGQTPLRPEAPEATVSPDAPNPAPMVPVSPVQSLVAQGVFPPNIRSGMPVTRAQWATILIRALRYDTALISEFPVYRDVPRDYWAYAFIESARNRELITDASEDGFYRPERPVTYADVYRAIAKAITGPPPSPERAAELLSGFSDRDALPEELKPAIATLSGTRLFWSRERQALRPPWGDTVTPEGLAPLIVSLMYLTAGGAALPPGEIPLPALPANLVLPVSPLSAVFREGLSRDQGIPFSLVSPVGPLPAGSRINGIVRDVEGRTARVGLVEAVTPAGSRYRTRAELTLEFPRRARSAVIVPGTALQTGTLPVEGVPSMAVPFVPSSVEPSPGHEGGEETVLPGQPDLPPLEPPERKPPPGEPPSSQ